MILDTHSDRELRSLIEDAIDLEGDTSYSVHLASYVMKKYQEELESENNDSDLV